MAKEQKTLSINEQENIAGEIDELKKRRDQLTGKRPLDANQGISYGPMKDDSNPVDVAKLEGIIKHKESILERGRPVKVPKYKAKALQSEIDVLEEQLKGKFLTKAELNLKPRDRGDFRRAVQKARAGECNPNIVKAAERLKFLRSRLDPSNPEMRSLDYLRV